MPAFFRRFKPSHWIAIGFAVAFALVFGWLMVTAPPWALRHPAPPPSLVLLAADGSELARRGPKPLAPVDVSKLPANVRNAFIAIEDRRFYRHGALDPKGMARAAWRNLRAGHVVEGGSTLTQQLAKNAWLSNDRTWGRKLRETLLAGWLEMWLTKDEIFGRYLETVYFGDNAYGLTEAARHYFGRTPDKLTLPQAAMLAGLVKAPSRLSPANDRAAAANRMRTVLGAMVDAKFLAPRAVRRLRAPRLVPDDDEPQAQTGGWFGDWVTQGLPRDATGTYRTTLDPALQSRMEQVVASAPLGAADIAMVSLRADGSVVAMVGGKRYQPGGFNRVTQALRQPGSTFKLFDYLAAFRAGQTPDSTVLDAPLQIGNWAPTNAYDGYYGPITFRDAFARSSNLAAVRVAESAGRANVIRVARDLGVTAQLPQGPSLALGVANLKVLELAQAYAAVMAGRYPVSAHGMEGGTPPPNLMDANRERRPMLDLLWHAANEGTGRDAALDVATYGKTGTTQDGRDALFVGFAGDLLTAVWIGRDDNAPMPGASGGHLPAAIWHAFMNGIPVGPLPDPNAASAPVSPMMRGALPPLNRPSAPPPAPVEQAIEPDSASGADQELPPEADQPDQADGPQLPVNEPDPSGRSRDENGGDAGPPQGDNGQ